MKLKHSPSAPSAPSALAALAALSFALGIPQLAHADEPQVAVDAAPVAVPARPEPPAPVAPFVPSAAPAPAPTSAPTPDANEPNQEDDDRPKPGQWYGYQTLAVDVASLALVALSIRAQSGEFALASLGTYVIGPPIVHFAHGNVAKGFGDLGLRLGLPVGGAFLGAGIGCALGGCSGHGDFAGYGAVIGAVFGTVSGGVAAMILDWTLLSREPGTSPKASGRRAVNLAPSLAVTPTGGALGLGGSF